MSAQNSTHRDLLRTAAREAIEAEAEVALDVAAEHGQIFANVSHLKWFHEAVAEELSGMTVRCGEPFGHFSIGNRGFHCMALTNGAQEVVADDGGEMSEDEWQAYCATAISSARSVSH